MALAIVELNKKGYKTIYSCSGHIFHDLNEVTIMPGSACTINGAFMEVPADCEPKVCAFIQSSGYCYLVFASSYHFPYLPDGFKY